MASAAAMLSLSPSYYSHYIHGKGLDQIATSTRRRGRRTRLSSSSSSNMMMVTRSCHTDSKTGLLQAAHHTVDTYIKSGMVIGLGSGDASGLAIQYLGRQLRTGAIKDIVGVPTSVDCASEAAKAGIPLDQYQDSSQIDFAFNDADIIEEGTLGAIIGRQRRQGKESMIEEKTILKAAEKLVFMITGKQYKVFLDGSIPVLIKPLGWMETAEEIEDLFLGDAEVIKHSVNDFNYLQVWRRSSVGHSDPLGGDFPLVTREGHNVLDLIFTSPISNLVEVGESLDKIDGVVAHGVISKFPCTAVIATEDGLRIVDNTSNSEMSELQ